MHASCDIKCHTFARISSTMIPTIFHSTVLRRRILYDDLSKKSLTVDEKTFLANEALGISEELSWEAGNSSISNRITRLTRLFKIPSNTIKGWVGKVSNGIVIPNGTGGRPPAMDQEAGARFIQTLKARRESDVPN